MGWNPAYIICPNCKCKNEDLVDAICDDSNRNDLYMVCYKCGLHLYAKKKVWEPTSYYIDKSVIGKDHENYYENKPNEIVDKNKNDKTIKLKNIKEI